MSKEAAIAQLNRRQFLSQTAEFMGGGVLVSAGLVACGSTLDSAPSASDYQNNAKELSPEESAVSVLIQKIDNDQAIGHGGLVYDSTGKLKLISVNHVIQGTLTIVGQSENGIPTTKQNLFLPGVTQKPISLQIDWQTVHGTSLKNAEEKSDEIVYADLPNISGLEKAISDGRVKPLKIIPYASLPKDSQVLLIRADKGSNENHIYAEHNPHASEQMIDFSIPENSSSVCTGMSGEPVFGVDANKKLLGVCGVLFEIHDSQPTAQCTTNKFIIIPFKSDTLQSKQPDS